MKTRINRERKYENLKEWRYYEELDSEEMRILRKKDMKRLRKCEFDPDVTRCMAEGWGLPQTEVEMLVRLSMHHYKDKVVYTDDEKRSMRLVQSRDSWPGPNYKNTRVNKIKI